MSKSFYLKLVEELIEHDRRYYDEAKPLISDYEYDQKMVFSDGLGGDGGKNI